MAFTQNIYGTTGDDYLSGADEGDDFIYGRRGNDQLFGFARHDYLFGGEGNDRLDGGGGSDFLLGGPGADHLEGGLGLDYADYGSSGRAVTITLSGGAGHGIGGAAHGDSLVGIEAVFGSTFNDVMSGGNGAQYFAGWDGYDILSGGLGADILDGGDGDDRLSGDSGDDLLQGGAGADALFGDDGFDMAAYYGGEVLVDLQLPDQSTADAAGDRLMGVEGLYGSQYADTLLGDASDNTLIGNGGDDLLNGRGGNDVLRGGDPNDRLFGGVGDDILQGGGALLNGGPGNDSLNDGVSFFAEFKWQRMVGGEGADVFHTNALDSSVVLIGDFQPGADTLYLFFSYGYLPSGSLDPSNFVQGTRAADADDYIIYDRGTGRLWFDADGAASGSKQLLIARLTNQADISAADILI